MSAGLPPPAPLPVPAPGQRAWRALGWFWALLAFGVLGTLAVLGWLGGPVVEAPRQLVAPAPAGAAAPGSLAMAPGPLASAPEREPEPEAVPRPLVPLPEVLLPDLTLAELLPAAPEPPPLPGARPAAAPEPPVAPPDPALLQDSPAGPLPRIGADGREPRHAYARAFDRADTRPRIGLVLLGGSDPALRRLPAGIALGLATPPAALLELARARGMETLLLLPQPADAPPAGLEAALARFAGYVGVLAPAGDVDVAVQDSLRRRGLLLLGTAAPTHAWGRAADLVLEDAPTRGEIDRQLQRLEQLARERGAALGLLPAARPLLVERVAAWAASLPQRGLVLAPVTTLIRRPSQVTPP